MTEQNPSPEILAQLPEWKRSWWEWQKEKKRGVKENERTATKVGRKIN